MWDARFIDHLKHTGWYATNGHDLIGPYTDEGAAKCSAANMTAQAQKYAREVVALQNALRSRVPDAVLWKAIEDGTILQFETPSDEPLIVETN